MGLVQVHGKAKGDRLFTSPVTNTRCLFYKVDIEKYVKDSQGHGRWEHHVTDYDGAAFYVDDGTGKVLVNPTSAELDLMETGKRQTKSSSSRSWRQGAYGEGDPTLYTGTQVTDYGLASYAESLQPDVKSRLTDSLKQLVFQGSVDTGMTPTGEYILTEYCILPDHWYDVTGTCVENPSPREEHDRNMIVKGENEPTFLISWRGKQSLESSLRSRAAKYIFGGAALSVVCLGFLLKKFGWL